MTATSTDPQAAAPESVRLSSRPGALPDLLRPVRARLLLGAFLSAVAAAARVVPAIAVAETAKTLLRNGPASTVWWWVVAGVVAAVAGGAIGLVSSQVCHHADADFRYLTRIRVVRHLATLPLGWFSQRGSGEVRKAVADDVKQIHTVVAHAAADLTAAVVGPIVIIAYLAVLDWRMTVLLVVYVAVVYAVLSPRMASGYRTNMGAYENAQAELSHATVELTDGIEVVKTYGTGTGVYRRFALAVDRLSTVSLRWMAGIGGPVIWMGFLFSAATLGCWVLGTGFALIELGWTDFGVVVAFLAVGVGLPAGITQISQLQYSYRDAQVGAAHVAHVLEEAPLPEPAEPREPHGPEVRFEDVSFSYEDGTPALRGISAVLRPGTVTAVVGPSGSGKTTLARLVPRFWDAGQGRVLVGGVDVRDVAIARLLGTVSFVFQETVLLRDTVEENIRLGRPAAGRDEVVEAARQAGIHDRIERLPRGYDTVLGTEDAGTLSGGEEQRVAIARVLLQDAPVVVLDEATAHADPHSETAVQRALSALAAERTLLVIAHRLHTIASADQILVLDGGRLAEHGTHDELLAADGLYRRLWDLQQSSPDARLAAEDRS